MSEPIQPDPATEPIPAQRELADDGHNDDRHDPFPWLDAIITGVEILVLGGVGVVLVLGADRLPRIAGVLCVAIAGYLVANLIQFTRDSHDDADDACDVCDFDDNDGRDQERGVGDTADATAGDPVPDGGQP